MNSKPKQPVQQKPAFDWKFIIGLFLTFIIVSYIFNMFSGQKSVKLPYSTFKNQVKDGNILEVKINGQNITGTFEKAYQVVTKSKKDTLSYTAFSTVKPDINDPELMKILDDNKVTINAEAEGTSWGHLFLFLILPWILIIGFFAYTRKKMFNQLGGMGSLFGMGRSKAKRFLKSSSNVTFEDVAGLDNAKKDLREIIDYLKEPEKFSALGANVPRGVLLIGLQAQARHF
jgi:cell division protease FtsH